MKHESSLLFQRLNFFLVGTAFLITAFATLTFVYGGDYGQSCKPLILAYMINAVGLFLSAFFMLINYLNTRILWHLRKYTVDLESNYSKSRRAPETPLSKAKEIIEEIIPREMPNPCVFAKSMWQDLCSVFDDLAKSAKKTIAPHTWIVPLGFTTFWLVTFFLVLPIDWIPTTIVFGSLGIVALKFVAKKCRYKPLFHKFCVKFGKSANS